LFYFFGKHYHNFKKYEIMTKTKKIILLHNASQAQLKELFTIHGQCTTEFEDNDNNAIRLRTCSRKVNMRKNGKTCLGYILDENETQWKVQTV